MQFAKQNFLSLFESGNGHAIWTNIPLLGLITANIMPLIGVLFLKWNVFYIVLLYWAENLVIGFYNVLKIATVKVDKPAENLGKLFIIPFFMVHYGMFTMVHGIFVFTLFGKDQIHLNIQRSLAGSINQVLMSVPPAVRFAFLMLVISHGISFAFNYILKEEYKRINPATLMGQPYARVFVMHLTIMGGGFLLMAIGSPAAMLVILVGLKTVIDVKLHQHEHKKIGEKLIKEIK